MCIGTCKAQTFDFGCINPLTENITILGSGSVEKMESNGYITFTGLPVDGWEFLGFSEITLDGSIIERSSFTISSGQDLEYRSITAIFGSLSPEITSFWVETGGKTSTTSIDSYYFEPVEFKFTAEISKNNYLFLRRVNRGNDGAINCESYTISNYCGGDGIIYTELANVDYDGILYDSEYYLESWTLNNNLGYIYTDSTLNSTSEVITVNESTRPQEGWITTSNPGEYKYWNSYLLRITQTSANNYKGEYWAFACTLYSDNFEDLAVKMINEYEKTYENILVDNEKYCLWTIFTYIYNNF